MSKVWLHPRVRGCLFGACCSCLQPPSPSFVRKAFVGKACIRLEGALLWKAARCSSVHSCDAPLFVCGLVEARTCICRIPKQFVCHRVLNRNHFEWQINSYCHDIITKYVLEIMMTLYDEYISLRHAWNQAIMLENTQQSPHLMYVALHLTCFTLMLTFCLWSADT